MHFYDRCQIAYTTRGLDLGPVAHGLLDQSHVVQGCSGGRPTRASLDEGNSGFHGDLACPDNFLIRKVVDFEDRLYRDFGGSIDYSLNILGNVVVVFET